MHQETDFPYGYHKVLECQAVCLPYVERTLSMIILLPSKEMGVDKLLHHLEPEDLQDIEGSFKMEHNKVNLWLPRFSLEVYGIDQYKSGLVT